MGVGIQQYLKGHRLATPDVQHTDHAPDRVCDAKRTCVLWCGFPFISYPIQQETKFVILEASSLSWGRGNLWCKKRGGSGIRKTKPCWFWVILSAVALQKTWSAAKVLEWSFAVRSVHGGQDKVWHIDETADETGARKLWSQRQLRWVIDNTWSKIPFVLNQFDSMDSIAPHCFRFSFFNLTFVKFWTNTSPSHYVSYGNNNNN